MSITQTLNIRCAAAAGFLGAAVVYLGAEAITAAAWGAPSYSYIHDWISTLGACGPSHGRYMCSPLRDVMNTAFVLRGVLFAIGGIFLAASMGWVGAPVFVAFAIIHAIGIGLVGLVPKTTPAPAGTLHFVGAVLAIAGGNLAVMAGGSAIRPVAPRWFPTASWVLGILGFAFLVSLGVLSELKPSLLRAVGAGLVERVSVYTVNAWEIAAGILLLRAARAEPRQY